MWPKKWENLWNPLNVWSGRMHMPCSLIWYQTVAHWLNIVASTVRNLWWGELLTISENAQNTLISGNIPPCTTNHVSYHFSCNQPELSLDNGY